jgi:hypothetical protein
MDNYEWQEAYRPESKFGLFRIDRNTRDGHPNFNRQITKGAEAFKLIIEKSITPGAGENGVILDFALSERKINLDLSHRMDQRLFSRTNLPTFKIYVSIYSKIRSHVIGLRNSMLIHNDHVINFFKH